MDHHSDELIQKLQEVAESAAGPLDMCPYITHGSLDVISGVFGVVRLIVGLIRLYGLAVGYIGWWYALSALDENLWGKEKWNVSRYLAASGTARYSLFSSCFYSHQGSSMLSQHFSHLILLSALQAIGYKLWWWFHCPSSFQGRRLHRSQLVSQSSSQSAGRGSTNTGTNHTMLS